MKEAIWFLMMAGSGAALGVLTLSFIGSALEWLARWLEARTP